jgi:hypothetical protein
MRKNNIFKNQLGSHVENTLMLHFVRMHAGRMLEGPRILSRRIPAMGHLATG